MGRSRWKCQVGPRQGSPEVQSQVEESQGEKDSLTGLHLAGGVTGAGEVWSTLEHLEEPWLIVAPYRCREVPVTS